MARVPVPGRGLHGDRQLSAPPADGDELVIPLPPAVQDVFARLHAAGHEAALVGGSVRDRIRTQPVGPWDWDLATSAHPETAAALLPGAVWQNRFGTVTVPGEPPVQVTTYRAEGGYRDRRRPDEVRFGVTLDEDLARRDFTINAIAWVPTDLELGHGTVRDPYGGLGDLAAGRLRAVGDPRERFAEDALRLLRAVRFAARFGFEVEPATLDALTAAAPTAASVSGERLGGELLRMLVSDEPPWHEAPPSAALRLMEATGLLAVLLPELAALRGVPQGKPLPGDALDHSMRTMDAIGPRDPHLRLAGLLHDLGKATTLADGHFIGHEVVGAELAGAVADRLRLPARLAQRIGHLVRHHMFAYGPDWTDAAVRRFVRRVGRDALDDLFALREADNVASGVTEPAIGGIDEFRQRIAAVALDAPLDARQLAVDGHDLQAALGIGPSPELGRILAALLEAVIEDPTVNERAELLTMARRIAVPGR